MLKSYKTILTIANILLITASAGIAVDLFYKTVTSGLAIKKIPEDTSFSAISKRPHDSEKQPFSEYRAISERDLFHTSAEAAAPAEKPQIDLDSLKETDLKLKLWGTIAVSGGSGYAFIEDTTKRRQDLYTVGDTVQGATIKTVLRETVVLSVEGKEDEILQMEKKGESAFASKSSGDDQGSSISIKRSMIEESMGNMNQLMKEVRVRPHFTNGKSDGFRVDGIKRKSLFRDMGLRNGDIITGVNGEPIESVDDALKFYNKLTNASNVSLNIKRRGREETIEYQVE